MKLNLLLLTVLSGVLLLGSGCPATGVVCMTGTVRCGDGCIDPKQDSRNCGACGNACGSGQQCNAGQCVCTPGSVSCNGSCAVLDSDPKNCGACGTVCSADTVCEAGACKASCTAGINVKCGGSCVSIQTDPNNCGDCGAVCGTGESCKCGRCTFDFVAACFSTGQVVGFSETSLTRGSLQPLGSAPAALAAVDEVLLSVDGFDRKMYQANLRSPGGTALLSKLDSQNQVGAVANQVVVEGQWVYVANAETGSIQVLQKQSTPFTNADGGTGSGIAFSTVSELPLGTNTYPQGLVKVGQSLFVPLYGGYGVGPADAGQRVVKLSIDDAGTLGLVDQVDLRGLDLKAFDGGSPVARPWAVITHKNQVYVALNNLNATTYAPEGPGMLAKIDPLTLATTTIDLGAETCLNPQWLQSDGTRIFVSCGGRPTYDPNTFALLGTEKAGVIMLTENDQLAAQWEPKCATDAGLPDGGSSCAPFLPGRFAVKNNVVYVGDQNQGRIAILTVDNATTLTELKGPAAVGGRTSLQACPVPANGVSNVGDILTVPQCLTR